MNFLAKLLQRKKEIPKSNEFETAMGVLNHALEKRIEMYESVLRN